MGQKRNGSLKHMLMFKPLTNATRPTPWNSPTARPFCARVSALANVQPFFNCRRSWSSNSRGSEEVSGRRWSRNVQPRAPSL